MKFWIKLMVSIIMITSIILSISRYIVVRQNFINSVKVTVAQCTDQYNLERYNLESNIINNIKVGEEIDINTIIENIEAMYGYIENANMIGVFDGNREKIFSNFEDIDYLNIDFLFNESSDKYCFRKVKDKNYMIFSYYLSINKVNLYIINIYDVTSIYQERNRQVKEIMYVDIIILLISSFFISIFSIFLTKPINKLNDMSKKISSGNFNERIDVKSNDEIGELANNFNIMADEIENKINLLNLSIKQKDDFINAFTHEIKTPMTVIMGYSDLLRLKKCDEKVTNKALNYIYSESKRLEELSYKLLKLMSLSEEKIELEYIEIKSFIEKVISKIILDEVEIKIDMEKERIQSDESLLEVVIRNLVQNAYKSEPKDNIILIKGRRVKNNKYKISIIDKGKGIPKEHVNRVIEDFYMVDKSRSGGSGIGLSLCNKILNLFNSKINIISEENEGTEVYFELEVTVFEEK